MLEHYIMCRVSFLGGIESRIDALNDLDTVCIHVLTWAGQGHSVIYGTQRQHWKKNSDFLDSASKNTHLVICFYYLHVEP